MVAAVRSWCPIPATYLPGVTETGAGAEESRGIIRNLRPEMQRNVETPSVTGNADLHCRPHLPLKGEESG